MTCETFGIEDKREKGMVKTLETVCGIAVQLVFSDQQNREIPEIVGNILKGAYLQRQGI